ncbi:MAG: SCO family protein [Acidobacteria bacterium]|nr:SCO family protein [Acidobacteriota bacterium]
MSKSLVIFRGYFYSLLILVLLLSGSLTAGCSKNAGAERRFQLKGRVVAVDLANGKVEVDHEEIPGYMPAMQMPFSLADAEALKTIESGDEIQATLVVNDLGYRLEQPIITKALPGGAAASQAASAAEPKPGAEIPDFKLVNQDGKATKLRQPAGRSLLLTFIYTRCPLPDFCPLISGNFAEINRELEKDPALRDRTHLLSVTIDPAYDTPKVLRSYGGGYTEKYGTETFEHWEFATGEPAEIKRLATFFGLSYMAEKDQIIHSLRTALIGPDGRLFKVYRGNEWKPADVLQDIRNLPVPAEARP